MRKLLLTLAVLGLSTAAMAQETEVPTHKYSVATNSFWANWYVSAGAEYNAAYTSQEQGVSKNPFSTKRGVAGFNVAVGKWFTPGIGLRTKFQGLWGKQVNTETDHHTYNYWAIHEDVTFNLSNLLCGYNEKRVWNFIPFAGAGLTRSMTHNLYGMNYSMGILNTFRVSKKVGINFELGWDRLECDADGVIEANGSQQRGWDSHDNKFYAEVGLTFNLGKATWDKTPDVDAIKALSQAQIDALNAQLNDANAENARLKKLLAEKKDENKAVKEFVGTPVSVFFNINRYNIASKKDLVNVKNMAEFAKENDANLLVTGYADSATGKAPYNQKLSEKRANTVANELVKMGVNRDKITTEAKGGVNDLSPISFNRRATVQVKN